MRERPIVLATAFLEGLSVLVVEIAGARALAPFFGTSLKVWTAQITATLLFLALGYGMGGRLKPERLPQVFLAAGAWLVLYPFLRAPVLGVAAGALGVAAGSFAASCVLFGPPLLCLGAVSPLLIARLDAVESGAGRAAGGIFFTNTLGGLAGGWLTALLLIPRLPLRAGLAGCGLLLLALGVFWSLRLKRGVAAPAAATAAALLLALQAPRPAHSFRMGGLNVTVLESRESGVGLVQVLGMGAAGRSLLIDGVTQGGMSLETGTSAFEFTEYQNFLSHRFHPGAKSALLLGLGTGLLAKQLHLRGVRVSAAELEPAIERCARDWFGLPDGVKVVHEDARAYLNATPERYDLIFLDAFAGENAPWYLATREAMALMKSRLQPGGLLVINLVTRVEGSAGLARLEAALLERFPEVKVYVERPESPDATLVNAAVVAGERLVPSSKPLPSVLVERVRPRLAELLARERPAVAGAAAGTDDFSDLDYADAGLRSEWRRIVLDSMGPEVLGD